MTQGLPIHLPVPVKRLVDGLGGAGNAARMQRQPRVSVARCRQPRAAAGWVLAFLLLAVRLAQGAGTNAPALELATPPPPAQEPVNLNQPPRDYEELTVRGWSVLLERQLQQEAPELAKKVVARLDRKLGEAMAVLPAPSHPRLKQLRLFILYGPKSRGGGRDNGLEYFQRQAPQYYPNLDPRMGSAVVIYSAENYVWLTEFWALKALVHEFAHAHQLEQWPETQPDIWFAWNHAMQLGLYHHVMDDERNHLTMAYATANQLEYFAELSCMYFVGCNYHPFDRAQLRPYDPEGCALIERMWGVAPHE